MSWVEFKTEQLENFNWNRMDFYVCTRGDKVSSHDFFNFLLRAKNDWLGPILSRFFDHAISMLILRSLSLCAIQNPNLLYWSDTYLSNCLCQLDAHTICLIENVYPIRNSFWRRVSSIGASESTRSHSTSSSRTQRRSLTERPSTGTFISENFQFSWSVKVGWEHWQDYMQLPSSLTGLSYNQPN